MREAGNDAKSNEIGGGDVLPGRRKLRSLGDDLSVRTHHAIGELESAAGSDEHGIELEPLTDAD